MGAWPTPAVVSMRIPPAFMTVMTMAMIMNMWCLLFMIVIVVAELNVGWHIVVQKSRDDLYPNKATHETSKQYPCRSRRNKASVYEIFLRGRKHAI